MSKISNVRVLSLQLDLITDLLGTPSLEAMRTACEGAKAHILRGPHKQVQLHITALPLRSVQAILGSAPVTRDFLGAGHYCCIVAVVHIWIKFSWRVCSSILCWVFHLRAVSACKPG